jgi:hypothetical protein
MVNRDLANLGARTNGGSDMKFEMWFENHEICDHKIENHEIRCHCAPPLLGPRRNRHHTFVSLLCEMMLRRQSTMAAPFIIGPPKNPESRVTHSRTCHASKFHLRQDFLKFLFLLQSKSFVQKSTTRNVWSMTSLCSTSSAVGPLAKFACVKTGRRTKNWYHALSALIP